MATLPVTPNALLLVHRFQQVEEVILTIQGPSAALALVSLVLLRPTLHASRSMRRMICENRRGVNWFSAAVAFGELQSEVPSMSDGASACLEWPLLQARELTNSG